MDSKTLLEQGIAAVKRNDHREGRRLLKQALRLNPKNEEAWLWLARTEIEADRKRDCLEQALKANPKNTETQEMLAQLTPPAPERSKKTTTERPKTQPRPRPTGPLAPAITSTRQPRPQATKPPSVDAQKDLAALVKEAKKLQKKGQLEEAAEKWVQALRIQVDHEEALRNAVVVFNELGFPDDANELAWRAIKSGTTLSFAYQAAMRYARHRDRNVYDDLRKRLLRLPTVEDADILIAARQLIDDGHYKRGVAVLEGAIKRRPESQELLIAMGDLMRATGDIAQGLVYFNRAAQLGVNKEVEERLAAYPPILTDRERGSVGLAMREVVGIGFFYALLAWQDVGLDLFNLDLKHGLGIGLSVVAGYFLVTSTSSPQQKPLAEKLGGEVPQYKTDSPIVQRGYGSVLEEVSKIPMLPVSVQVIMAVAGIVLLLVAFVLVFGTSLQLLVDFEPYAS